MAEGKRRKMGPRQKGQNLPAFVLFHLLASVFSRRQKRREDIVWRKGAKKRKEILQQHVDFFFFKAKKVTATATKYKARRMSWSKLGKKEKWKLRGIQNGTDIGPKREEIPILFSWKDVLGHCSRVPRS